MDRRVTGRQAGWRYYQGHKPYSVYELQIAVPHHCSCAKICSGLGPRAGTKENVCWGYTVLAKLGTKDNGCSARLNGLLKAKGPGAEHSVHTLLEGNVVGKFLLDPHDDCRESCAQGGLTARLKRWIEV
jgi:hypothetical protein